MSSLTIIGDVHGESKRYLKVIENAPGCTVQLGDMGFDYDHLLAVDRHRHVWFPGNHDNYSRLRGQYRYQVNCIGDYGMFCHINDVFDWLPFFFVRGEWSIDHSQRVKTGKYRTWWDKEELTMPQMLRAISMFKAYKPKLMVTHGAPLSIVPFLTNPSFARQFGYTDPILTTTNLGLEMMLKAHKPKVWVFGHYHRPFDRIHDGVRFICLPELATITLTELDLL